MPTKRSPRRLAGLALLGLIVAGGVMPAYLALSPSWRPIAVRLVCTLAVIAGVIRAVRWARATAPATESLIDAPMPPTPGPELDQRFLALRDDVLHGTRSRRYFDVILGPRLAALSATQLPDLPPRVGWRRRRGPSLATLSAIVGEIERRP